MSYPDNPRNDPERTDVGDSPITDARTSTDLRESGLLVAECQPEHRPFERRRGQPAHAKELFVEAGRLL